MPLSLNYVTKYGNFSDLIQTQNNAIDADHDIDFLPGETWDKTKTIRVVNSSIMTKKGDATWAPGNNAGGMASGVSMPFGDVRHMFILSNSDGSLVDFGFDNNAVATNLLADSSVTSYFGGTPLYRRIAGVMGNVSGNFRLYQQLFNRFNLVDKVEIFNGNPPTSFRNLIVATPDNVDGIFLATAIARTSGQLCSYNIALKNGGTPAIVSRARDVAGSYGYDASGMNVFYVDGSRELRHVRTDGSNNNQVILWTCGWYDYRLLQGL